MPCIENNGFYDIEEVNGLAELMFLEKPQIVPCESNIP